MKFRTQKILKAVGLGILFVLSMSGAQVLAFDSGSTGADGSYAPSSNTTLILPPNGILNFTTLNIPSGVTVWIASNIANTPAYILVQGDAVIDGVIDISGVGGDAVGSNPAGGFAGGIPLEEAGGNGNGPGGGRGGPSSNDGGNGGTYGTLGQSGTSNFSPPGSAYGSSTLQPLLGGSGGGASKNTTTSIGNRGGGGGGALLLAVGGTLTLAGSIEAIGGAGGVTADSAYGGGGGSGGGVRMIASTLAGSGVVDISGGARGQKPGFTVFGGAGGIGRARLEADAFAFSGTVIPNVVTTSAPLPIFAANLPSIRISSVAGNAVSLTPVGENDVVLPSSIVNPVVVEFAATDIPLGSTVQLTVSPLTGSSTTVISDVLDGTVASSIASVMVNLPQGASVLLASVSFAVTAELNHLYAPFADGEMVARVELTSGIGSGAASMRLITESGRIVEMMAPLANL